MRCRDPNPAHSDRNEPKAKEGEMTCTWFSAVRCIVRHVGLGPGLPGIIALVLVSVGAVAPGTAQQMGSVTGTVVDAQSGNPVSDAQILVEGTGRGVLSNSQGRFLVTEVPVGTHTVTVERIGYAAASQTVAVSATPPAVVSFRLRQTAYELESIVVTGTPGEERVRELGNSIGQIQAEPLVENSAANNISLILSGSEPGVEFSYGGGGPQAPANIRIRGAASIALSSEPLIYIDGVRVSNSRSEGPGTSYREDGPLRLNDIDPNEIESIEVVKGPSAATLYGTEASNGVINIITKSGSTGPATITAKVEAGFMSLPGFASGEEFYDVGVGYRCQGFPESGCTPGEIVRVNVLQNDRERFGRTWFRKGATQLYSVNMRGGSEDVRYFFSGSWSDEQGVTFDSWLQQFNTRANIDWTATDRLSVQLGLGIVWSNSRSNQSNQPWSLGITFACPAPTCEPGSGGAALDDPAGVRGYFAYTPQAIVDYVHGGEQINRQIATSTITYRPRDWLTSRLTVGADWVDINNHELYTPLPDDVSGHFVPGGRKSVRFAEEVNYSVDFSATGATDVTDDIGLATSAGFQLYQRATGIVDARGDNFPISTLETVGSGANLRAGETFVENKTAGVYVQEKVSWQDRLFLTGAVRADDNSAFGQDFELVTYPKVSASWVVSEEGFMLDSDWIDQLKLRGAWGKAGQQPSTFAAVRTYRPVSGPDGAGTITRDNIGNSAVEPEVGQEWEVGFDGVFMAQRLTLEATYYNQTRENALIQVLVRPSLGFGGTQWQNLGKTSNKGVELGALWHPLRVTEDGPVGLDLGLNFSYNDNKVVSLGGLPPVELHGSNPTTDWGHQRFVEGFPMGAIFLKKIVSADIINGVGTPEARATNIMCEGGPIIPGTMNLSRGGGGPVPCADAPEVYRGTPISSHVLSGTATVSLLGGDLELFGQVDAKFGAMRIDADLAGAHVFVNSSLAILERTEPLLLAMQELGNEGINQSGLVDADFAKLRRLSAKYHLPQSWADLTGANNGTITLSAFNVGWIWRAQSDKFGLKTLDSEQRVMGTANGLQAVHHEGWPNNLHMKLAVSLTF